MFGIGIPEFIVISIILLVVFGAGKIPEVAGALGKSINSFKKAMAEKDEIELKAGMENDVKKAGVE